MAFTNPYLQGVYDGLAKRNPEQKEFLQAAEEVLESLEPVVAAHPEYEEAGLIERLVEPERVVMFRVPWVDDAGKSFEGQRVVISGSGNVATYANQKATQLGGKVIAMSDSNGYIVDENGIDYKVIKEIKEVKRARIKTYLEYVPTAKYVEGSQGIWTVPCDIALPCATQNELRLDGAKALVANGCYCVAEGANMPSTPEAIAYLQSHGILFAPAKASNAGGVATSGLEMSQNSLRLSWTFEEVDERLHNIMVNIYKTAATTAEKYGMKGNLVAGANIAGFEKIASAMMSQGIV